MEEEALRKCSVLELTWCLCLSSMEICSCEVENRSLHAFAQFSTLGIHLCNLALNSYSASSISVSQLIRRFLAILNDASVDDDIPGIPRRLHHGSIFYLLHLAQPLLSSLPREDHLTWSPLHIELATFPTSLLHARCRQNLGGPPI